MSASHRNLVLVDPEVLELSELQRSLPVVDDR